MTKAESVKEVSKSTGIENATVIIPETKVPTFKPCPDFKNRVK